MGPPASAAPRYTAVMLRRPLAIAFVSLVVLYAAYFVFATLTPHMFTGFRADLVDGRTLVKVVVHWNTKLVPGEPTVITDAAELNELADILSQVPRVVLHRSAVAGGGIELTFSDGSTAAHGIYRRGDKSWGLIGIGDGGMGFSERWGDWCEARLRHRPTAEPD